MNSCWERDPQKRPKFSELVEVLDGYLGSMADYLSFAPTTEEGTDVSYITFN